MIRFQRFNIVVLYPLLFVLLVANSGCLYATAGAGARASLGIDGIGYGGYGEGASYYDPSLTENWIALKVTNSDEQPVGWVEAHVVNVRDPRYYDGRIVIYKSGWDGVIWIPVFDAKKLDITLLYGGLKKKMGGGGRLTPGINDWNLRWG